MVDYQPLTEDEMSRRFVKVLDDVSGSIEVYPEDVIILWVPLKFWEIAKRQFSVKNDGSDTLRHGNFYAKYKNTNFIFIEHKENIFDSTCVSGVGTLFR